MISIKAIRKDRELIKKGLSLKHDNTNLEKVLNLDTELRELKTKANNMRAERNTASESIGEARKAGLDAHKEIQKTRELGNRLKEIENNLNNVSQKLEDYLYQIPNLPHKSVPKGIDESDNVVIRLWGDRPEPKLNYKTHLEIGERLQLFDFQKASKISGSGFPLYKGGGAKLERSLINFMIEHHVDEYGFVELFPPVLMRKESMKTTGQLPKFEQDMYHTELDNLYLAPTAEVPITNVHRDEIIDEMNLPIFYVAYSPCFRRESGSYGKLTRGLLRVHQFNKVELVKFTIPEASYDELEKLTAQAESVLQKLGLHYRVVELCGGDLSFAASKCYDLEVWAPGEKQWLEVSSCSNFESFQSRRGNIRYRKKEDGNVDFLHTLNGSGLATSRLMVALIETYQTENGVVRFPDDVADCLGIKELS